MQVIKRNGKLEDFDITKIAKAIRLAESRTDSKIEGAMLYSLTIGIRDKLIGREVVSVSEIHQAVVTQLEKQFPSIAKQYREYVGYKERYKKTMGKIYDDTKRILEDGDKENANKDSELISTQKELVSGVVSKNIALDYELTPEQSEAHKSGAIQIHDLTDYIFNSFNCCLFDMANLLKGGFTINGIKEKEPNSIKTALTIVSDIILSASSQQFGGFTVPEIDKVLAPYVYKSIEKYKQAHMKRHPNASLVDIVKWAKEDTYADLLQGFESIENRLNTINNSNGQTSFTTFSFGLGMGEAEKMVSEAILTVRMEGLGENKITAIFPKLVFFTREEVNRGVNSPNHYLYEMAIKCQMKRMYPDILSLEEGYLKEMYEKYGTPISPMGCRSFLSEWVNMEGKGVFVGRGNCGVISLNLPRYALESDGDIARFYELVDKYIDMAIDLHLYKFEKMRKQKASSNPLMFCEGGCAIRLKPDDTIEKAIKTFTWSIGYIGLDEVCRYFTGKPIQEVSEVAEEILDHIVERVDSYKEKHGLLFSLYSTPAESMCYRFLLADRERFGVVPGVTDKEYYTNSFHVQVRENITAIHKQNVEAKFFHKVPGGRIVYNEFPHTKNFEAVKQVVDHASKLGLYFGVNIQLDSCLDCNHEGEFSTGKCSKCGTDNILRVNRVCGYLGYKTRFNKGKDSEVDERVDHFNM